MRNFLVHGDIRINERGSGDFSKTIKGGIITGAEYTTSLKFQKKNINAPSLPKETNFNAHKTFKKMI